MTDTVLEVCCGDLGSVAAAAEGGAGRVELCVGLGEGGFTPSAAMVEAAMRHNIKVNVLVRARSGDFLYTDDEKAMMLRDAEMLSRMGVNAVVCGALLADGSIDTDFCRALANVCRGTELTFHRAFDVCRDPLQAMEQLIELGFTRILTSGQAASALDGADLLRRLVEQSRGRITILAGGGVNPHNAAMIMSRSGVTELHASARTQVKSLMQYRVDGVSMGAPESDEYIRATTSAAVVRDIVNAMKTVKI